MRVISPEQHLLAAGVTDYNTAAVGAAWAEASRELRAALADPAITTVFVTIGTCGSGKSHWAASQPDLAHAVIFDAVHSDPKRRAARARQIITAGRRAVAVQVHTPLGMCLERNAARPPGPRVPEAFLRRAWAELQREPVTDAEGWSDVWNIPGVGTRQDRVTDEDRDRRAGRTYYRWRTEEDDRVRPEHRARHGRLFAWIYPPDGGHPGSDFGCRCVAEMVSDDDVIETVGGSLRARPLTVPTWARRR